MSHRERRGCDYDAYVPDYLSGRTFLFEGDTAADLAEAEADIARLNQEGTPLADSEALARLLLRSDAAASSRIEGMAVGPRRLLQAEAGYVSGRLTGDTAHEIVANIDALSWAVESSAVEIRLETLLETHRRLLAGVLSAITTAG